MFQANELLIFWLVYFKRISQRRRIKKKTRKSVTGTVSSIAVPLGDHILSASGTVFRENERLSAVQELLGKALCPQEAAEIAVEAGGRVFVRADQEVEEIGNSMNVFWRESLSYFGLYRKLFQVEKKYTPVKISYGDNKEQYFLYYEPDRMISDKIVVWVHGGGWNAGGPYSFRKDQGLTIKLLLDQLFKKGYNRRNGEPVVLMGKSHIPMLLIQSKHDGLIDFACAEDFAKRAKELGNDCELYSVTDEKNTHSWYTAGIFLETREENKGLDKFFSWIEER